LGFTAQGKSFFSDCLNSLLPLLVYQDYYNIIVPTTMTGHKPGSHKAKKKTHSSVTKATTTAEKKLDLATPDDTTARAVTQTQNAEIPLSPLYVIRSPLSVFPLQAPVTCSSQ
jgi:hypothetical protein